MIVMTMQRRCNKEVWNSFSSLLNCKPAALKVIKLIRRDAADPFFIFLFFMFILLFKTIHLLSEDN
jgi:hypothetical protein